MHDASDVTVRLAGPGDASAAAAILAEAFEEYRAEYSQAAYRATTPTSDEITVRFDEGPIWLALLAAGTPIGTVSAVACGDGVYVRSMGVTSAGRGRGVGLRLLEHVEEFARTGRHHRVYLSTTPFLIHAIALYERFGFRRIPDGPHDLHGTPLFTMEMLLTLR